jgi:hypothetical protein
MPNRSTFNTDDKYDHSDHATAHRQTEDLLAPGSTKPREGEPLVDTSDARAPRRQGESL